MEKKPKKSYNIVIQDIPYSQKKGKIFYDYPHKREPHELEFAEILIRFGSDIIFIKPSIITGVSTPDCEWRNKIWEIKTIFENEKNRIPRSLKNAFKQSKDVIIDISRCSISVEKAISDVLDYFNNPRNSHGLMYHEIMIIDKNRYCIINKKVLK